MFLNSWHPSPFPWAQKTYILQNTCVSNKNSERSAITQRREVKQRLLLVYGIEIMISEVKYDATMVVEGSYIDEFNNFSCILVLHLDVIWTYYYVSGKPNHSKPYPFAFYNILIFLSCLISKSLYFILFSCKA